VSLTQSSPKFLLIELSPPRPEPTLERREPVIQVGIVLSIIELMAGLANMVAAAGSRIYPASKRTCEYIQY
jgi:hypothetical protein